MGYSTKQVVVFGNLRAVDGRVDELLANFAPVVGRNRTEIGNIIFDVHQSSEDPDLVMCHEVWESQEDFDRHYAQEHVRIFLKHMIDEGYGEQAPLYPAKRVI
jgi:quinol monooxygenase YgiN